MMIFSKFLKQVPAKIHVAHAHPKFRYLFISTVKIEK